MLDRGERPCHAMQMNKQHIGHSLILTVLASFSAGCFTGTQPTKQSTSIESKSAVSALAVGGAVSQESKPRQASPRADVDAIEISYKPVVVNPEAVKCTKGTQCVSLDRWPDFDLEVPIALAFSTDQAVVIDISLSKANRPDCDRQISQVAVWIDTAGLNYDLAACGEKPSRCMDYVQWQWVDEWSLWDENSNRAFSRGGECNGCELRIWSVGDESLDRAANSLCGGTAQITVKPQTDTNFEIHSIYFLVWYE